MCSQLLREGESEFKNGEAIEKGVAVFPLLGPWAIMAGRKKKKNA